MEGKKQRGFGQHWHLCFRGEIFQGELKRRIFGMQNQLARLFKKKKKKHTF